MDVIHTGAGILGQWSPSGHADFYVNGGTSQPGCASSTLFSEYRLHRISIKKWLINCLCSLNAYRNSCMRSHQSHAIFYWIDKQSKGILRWTVSQSSHIHCWLVSTERIGIRSDGRTLQSKVSIWVGLLNDIASQVYWLLFACLFLQSTRNLLRNDKSRSTIRPRISRQKCTIK